MTDEETLVLEHFDEAFDHIGHAGRYQVFLFMALLLLNLGPGMQAVAVIFLSAEQDHWCSVPALQNLTKDQQLHVAIPKITRDGEERYDGCNMFDLPYANYSQKELEQWNRTIATDGVAIVPCTGGWLFDQSMFISTINSQVMALLYKALQTRLNTYTYTYTYIHTYLPKYIHTYIYTYLRTHIHLLLWYGTFCAQHNLR